RFDRQARALQLYDRAHDSAWGAPPPIESGGGGLVGTIDDYFAFSRMMLANGRHGSTQILSRASVALMTSDQLTQEQRAGSSMFFGSNCSWGFGMSVDIHRDQLYRSPGRFGWDGGLGTSGYIDPVEQLIGILFTQRMMDSPEPPAIFNDFWTTAYAAMD
ncbi:MAG TPA: serine hydrolase, partial [Polyangia bacterium]|nr:serine hydrolase [Polyangia bacterium]